MKLVEQVTRGCLLKITPTTAKLLMSGYCPEELRNKFSSRSKEVLSKLIPITDSFQGIFNDPNFIVMENFTKTRRVQFVWREDVLMMKDHAGPQTNKKRPHQDEDQS